MIDMGFSHIAFVKIAFQAADQRREQITLASIHGDGEACRVYSCTDPTFEAMANNGLISARTRDGKMVSSTSASIADWVNLLELDYGPIEVLEGQIPTRETTDPQDSIEQ